MSIILQVFLFSIGLNLLLFCLAFAFQTDKLTDISYSATFLVITTYGLMNSGKSAVDFIAWALVLIWALRLGGYLFYRVYKMGRDSRFDDIRAKPFSFLGFWVMQGITCAVVSLPVLGIFETQAYSQVGVLIFTFTALAGWGIETLADAQKFTFKLKHPDDFISEGLWKNLRHPNYTGELLFWWSIFLLAISLGAPYWTVVGPLWISFIIIFFSGIPPLEKKWMTKYMSDPQFQNYWKNSWRLIPGLY